MNGRRLFREYAKSKGKAAAEFVIIAPRSSRNNAWPEGFPVGDDYLITRDSNGNEEQLPLDYKDVVDWIIRNVKFDFPQEQIVQRLSNSKKELSPDQVVVHQDEVCDYQTDPGFKLPKYVRMGHTAMRLSGDRYYRDAGDWGVGFRVVGGVLVSWVNGSTDGGIHNNPLIEITEEEWREDNQGYI